MPDVVDGAPSHLRFRADEAIARPRDSLEDTIT